MVQVTKGKNVVIETYDAEFKEFIATAAQTAFTMVSKAAETDPEYTKTKNGAYSVQQAIQMQVSTKTIEIAELGNDAVTSRSVSSVRCVR
ncbi:hypothetical protein ig2599ANME_0908 [groundwater metagenome]